MEKNRKRLAIAFVAILSGVVLITAIGMLTAKKPPLTLQGEVEATENQRLSAAHRLKRRTTRICLFFAHGYSFDALRLAIDSLSHLHINASIFRTYVPIGRMICTAQPPSGALVSCNWPPCRSTISSQTARPIPLPRALELPL